MDLKAYSFILMGCIHMAKKGRQMTNHVTRTMRVHEKSRPSKNYLAIHILSNEASRKRGGGGARPSCHRSPRRLGPDLDRLPHTARLGFEG